MVITLANKHRLSQFFHCEIHQQNFVSLLCVFFDNFSNINHVCYTATTVLPMKGLRWDGNRYHSYSDSFLWNLSMKAFWKSVNIHRSYAKKQSGCFFLVHLCMLCLLTFPFSLGDVNHIAGMARLNWAVTALAILRKCDLNLDLSYISNAV